MRTATTIPTLLLLIGSFTPHAFAQQPEENAVERLTTSNGLTSNWIRGIAQDAQGFMWFATEDGLNKYDGYEVITYRHDPHDVNSLADNRITTIYADSRGARSG